MARRGLRYVAFGKLNETAGSYSDGIYLGASAQISGTVDVKTVDSYGDAGAREYGAWIRGGNLTWECVSDDDEIGSYLLGHTTNADGEQVIRVTDSAPYVGVAIVTRTDGGSWVAKFYPKVRFLPAADETDRTEGDGRINFEHTVLKGVIFLLDGVFRVRKTFTQQEDAIAWAKAKVGIVEDTTLLSEAENVLRLDPAGLTKSARVARLNTVLSMEDTSGTEDAQVTRAANALSLSASASTGSAVLDGFDERLDGAEERLDAAESSVTTLETKVGNAFAPRSVDAAIYAQLRDPYCLKPLDKGYVSFVFDDLRHDIDLVACVFAEYGMPLCLAAIPSRITNKADGLKEDRGSWTVGMNMFEVCQKNWQAGGETMAHNSVVITADNQHDYDTMYNYFFTTRERLEAWAGRTGPIRGIIRAGGSNQLSSSAEIDRWLFGAGYEYSDLGHHPEIECYRWNRVTINQPLADVKSLIDDCVANHTWLRFFGHDFEYGGGTTLASEQDLRDILDYVRASGAQVVTYGYMYDNFRSTWSVEQCRQMIAAAHA